MARGGGKMYCVYSLPRRRARDSGSCWKCVIVRGAGRTGGWEQPYPRSLAGFLILRTWVSNFSPCAVYIRPQFFPIYLAHNLSHIFACRIFHSLYIVRILLIFPSYLAHNISRILCSLFFLRLISYWHFPYILHTVFCIQYLTNISHISCSQYFPYILLTVFSMQSIWLIVPLYLCHNVLHSSTYPSYLPLKFFIYLTQKVGYFSFLMTLPFRLQ